MPSRKMQTRTRSKLSAKSRWPKRTAVIERYMRMSFGRIERAGQLTSAHNLGHVERVAFYAEKFTELFTANPALLSQTRIAGLSHDRIRYPTEKIPHEEASGAFMEKLFEKRYGKKATKRISDAVKKHGKLSSQKELGKNITRDALVFADKFFEANGAYIAFRRPLFMGERKDRREEAAKKGYDLSKKEGRKEAAVDFTLDETRKRITAFSDLSKIPRFLHPFVKYQVRWQKRLQRGLEKKEPWAINLATELFAEGLKEQPRPVETMIKNYKPVGKGDVEFKREAMRYLNGELWKEFAKRTSIPRKIRKKALNPQL